MRVDPKRPAAQQQGASPARQALPPAIAGPLAGVAGAAALVGVGTLMQGLLRVQSLPEVVSEWTTFYVPYAFFEYMINTYRGQAKVMLFWVIVALIALLAAGLGALYARRPTPRVAIGLAAALWLLTMVGLLPAAEMGFFGSEVRVGPMAVSAAYMASYAAFAMVLSLVYWLLVPAARQRRGPAPIAQGRSA
jgi:hypothetical protein